MRKLLGLLTALSLSACHHDMGGTYETTWDGTYIVRLTGVGAEQEQTVTGDGVVTFTTPTGDVELNLADYCGDENVICPEEVWPASVNFTETWKDAGEAAGDSQHSASASDIPGLVNHDTYEFAFLLDSAATVAEGASSDCVALQASGSTGTFDIPDGKQLPTGIVDGIVVVAWGGACAGFTSGAAVLAIREDFTAERTGDAP